MPDQRYIFFSSQTNREHGLVVDIARRTPDSIGVIVADVPRERARVLVMAANSAERERVEQGADAASTYTVEGVSVYVTADQTRWSGGPCLFCGMNPCDWTRPACRGEADSLPDVTLTFAGELVQQIVGPQAMAAIIDGAGDSGALTSEGLSMYLSASDANAQIATALDMLVRWRADAITLLAEIEADLNRAVDRGASVEVKNQAERVRDLLSEGVIA